MRNVYKILFVVAITGFSFALIPPESAFAGQCQAGINFQVQPNPVPENGTLVLSGYVDMSGSVWEPPGTANAGYCTVNGTVAKTIMVSARISAASRFNNLQVAHKTFNLVPYQTTHYDFSMTYKPADQTFKAGSSFNVVGVVNQEYVQLAVSSPITVNVSAPVYGIYYCVGPNSAGQDVYICDSKNDPTCANTSRCASKTPCRTLTDSSLCDQPISTATHKVCVNDKCAEVKGAGSDTCTTVGASCAPTHKGCVNGKCSNVSGAGSDTCTTVGASCAGGGPTTTKYTFNLPNPIGVESFQDLVNIIGKWIFNLAIPIAVIIIIYAGVLMLTAGGNPTKFKKGSMALWYAVLGLAVVLIGKGFVTLIQSILSLRNR
jgi:hypothetical protein